jgi:hypothetical protein
VYESGTRFSGVVAANAEPSIEIQPGLSGLTFQDIVAVASSTHGVLENGLVGEENVFAGALKVGGNATADCSALGDTPALVDSTCTSSGTFGSSDFALGSSTATLHPGIDASGIFVGRVVADDLVNASDNNQLDAAPAPGHAEFGNITDFVTFENPWRSWGKEAPSVFDVGARGPCPFNGECHIYDWRLRADDLGDPNGGGSGVPGPVALGVRPLPHGDDVLEHEWSQEWLPSSMATSQADCDLHYKGSVFDPVGPRCTTTHLARAWELLHDATGNDDGLCESGERCLWAPNLGAYQGHGPLVPVSGFVDGAISDVKLFRYKHNGVAMLTSPRAMNEDVISETGTTPGFGNDFIFELFVEGEATALHLWSCDEDGTATLVNGFVHEWDTVASAALSPAGTGYTGAQTILLAVEENASFLNGGDGSVSLGAGRHDLTLYANPGGAVPTGTRLCAGVVRPGGAFEVLDSSLVPAGG